MINPRIFAIIVLLGVCAFAGYTVYSRLHAGCSYHGARRSGGWDCASHPPGR